MKKLLLYTVLALALLSTSYAATIEYTAGTTPQTSFSLRSGLAVNSSTQNWAQSFTLPSGANKTLTSFAFEMNATASQAGFNAIAWIYAVNGSGFPTGSPLFTGNLASMTSVPVNLPATYAVNITFNTTATNSFSPSTQYAVVLGSDSAGSNRFRYGAGIAGAVSSIKADGGTTWAATSGTSDMNFILTYNDNERNFTISLTDQVDGSTINTFTSIVNGTYYNTTNGTIATNINATIGSLVNITVNATDYFNKTYLNWNTSTNLAATLYQVEVRYYASEILSGTNVTGFTVTGPNGSNSSTPPVLYLKAGTNNFTFNKTGWYNTTQQFTYTALQNTTSTFTDVYQYLLNITATNSSGSINTFSVNIYGTNYNATNSTTNGTILRGWVNDTVTVQFNASGSSLTNATTNFMSYRVPALVNITASLLTYNTFNLSFYNETTNLQLVNITVQLQVIGDTFAANYTITNGSINVTFVTPDDYQLIYWYDPEVPRSYFVTLEDQSYNNIRLYTLDESVSSIYLPVEQDIDLYACSDNTVSLLRHYIDINGYRVVEMAKTDTNGQAVLRVQPNIVNYKLLFTGTCGNFTTAPQKFTAQSDTFTVSDAQSPLTSIVGMESVTRSLTFNNATLTYVWTWSDSSNLVEEGCLVVTKFRYGVSSVVNNNCSTGASGSLIYTVTDTNNTRYIATGVIETTTEFSTYTEKLEESFATAYSTFGLTGVLLALLVIIAFITMGLGSTETTVMSGLFGIFIMGVFGFLYNTYTVLIGIAIAVVIIAYKTRT